jgi:hypothetical protein
MKCAGGEEVCAHLIVSPLKIGVTWPTVTAVTASAGASAAPEAHTPMF